MQVVFAVGGHTTRVLYDRSNALTVHLILSTKIPVRVRITHYF